MKESEGIPRLVPVINFFDITSLESWHNLSKITYVKSRKCDFLRDLCVTIHGLVFILCALGKIY